MDKHHAFFFVLGVLLVVALIFQPHPSSPEEVQSSISASEFREKINFLALQNDFSQGVTLQGAIIKNKVFGAYK